MAKSRDTYKYQYKIGNKIVHGGITKRPIDEREAEHQQEWPNGHILKVGPKVTEESAREWEQEKGYS